jgi:NAD(P)-dependent dehydrogenase (short-subunit alcohol dehydrogenase family)
MTKNKIALITGATDGIGKATALKLLTEGWEVVIIGRNPIKVETTVSELQTKSGNSAISGITADLSIMKDTKKASEKFLETHQRLDLLLLNANAIANKRIITTEGNEQNFALGYLSRVLMIKKLASVLEATTNSQVLSVIGLDTQPLDFEDLTINKDFTGRKGLTRWQWAINLFTTKYSQKSKSLMNLYIPGLVKTKILADEPQPSRFIVQIMNVVIGITPKKAAENLFTALNDIIEKQKRGATYAWAKERESLNIKRENGDDEKLMKLTDQLLAPYV